MAAGLGAIAAVFTDRRRFRHDQEQKDEQYRHEKEQREEQFRRDQAQRDEQFRREREQRAEQFKHEREQRAADDLLLRLDDVEAALERLGEVAAELGQVVFSHGPDPEHVDSKLRELNDTYQVARAQIARLEMRPHADDEVIGRAKAAADKYLEGWKIVRAAAVSRRLGEERERDLEVRVADLHGLNDEAIAGIREYEVAARQTIRTATGLLGRTVGRRSLLVRDPVLPTHADTRVGIPGPAASMSGPTFLCTLGFDLAAMPSGTMSRQ